MISTSDGSIAVRDIRTREELSQCVDMYISYDTWIKADRNTCLTNLFLAWKENCFVKVAVHRDRIIAFLYGRILKNQHNKDPVCQQMYFCSVGGLKGAKAALMLHNALIEFAKQNKISTVMSCGSHLDEHNKLPKFLEKHGWERRGYAVMFKVF